MPEDLRPGRFTIAETTIRGFRQGFVHEGRGGVPLLLVHGWPETKRIWWRNIAPLAAAGFEVIAPDLRGFGDSDVGPDGFHDVVSHSRDLYALVHDHLGHERVIVCGGDLGGPVIQDLSLRWPGFVERMVLFNSPLPYDKEAMAGINSRAPREAADYFRRQGTDADALAAELASPSQRQRYIATFYTSRFWAHPGHFDDAAVDFMTEPFGDAARLRASFGGYESAFSEAARSEPPMVATVKRNPTHTLILFGPSDHVLYPEYDRMAAIVFPDHVGPYILRDCGHFLQWEQADILNNTLRAFCRDVLAAGS
jgi:pimeloyl-ACP methyl ester carboxylesterase